jgi:hypothetical protein
MDDPTEEIHKTLHEVAEKSHDPALLRIALSSAIIAVLAAVATLMSEHQINEAMLAQLRASDQWSYYQAKGIKRNIVDGQIQILRELTERTDFMSTLQAQSKKYGDEQEGISKEATKAQGDSEKAFRAHDTFSYAVTLLQIAIGVSAVSALTRRRWLWITSMAVASFGLVFLGWGIAMTFFLV